MITTYKPGDRIYYLPESIYGTVVKPYNNGFVYTCFIPDNNKEVIYRMRANSDLCREEDVGTELFNLIYGVCIIKRSIETAMIDLEEGMVSKDASLIELAADNLKELSSNLSTRVADFLYKDLK